MKRQRRRICALLMAGFLLAGSAASDVPQLHVYAAEQSTENGAENLPAELTSPAGEEPADRTEGVQPTEQEPEEDAGEIPTEKPADGEAADGNGEPPAGEEPAEDTQPTEQEPAEDTQPTEKPAEDVPTEQEPAGDADMPPADTEGKPGAEGTEDAAAIDDAGTVFAAVTSIADVKAAATGTFTVRGTVIFVDGRNIYVQDATGGIDLYFAAAPSGVAVGNVLTATGSYTMYNGLIELGSAALEGTVESGDGTVPAAAVHTIAELLADYSGGKQLQSTRVRIENAVIGAVNTSGNTTLTQIGDDGISSSINIYRCPALSGVSAGDTVTVEAVVGAYNAPQLRVASAGDVVPSGQGTGGYGDRGRDHNPRLCAVAERDGFRDGDKICEYGRGRCGCISDRDKKRQ